MTATPNVSGSVQDQPQDKGTDTGAAETSLPGKEAQTAKTATQR